MTDTNDKLKPCPFCNGEAEKDFEFVGSGENTYYFIMCADCCAQSCSDSDEDITIKAWNTRKGQTDDA